MFNSPGRRTIADMVSALPASLHPTTHKRVDHNTLEWMTAGGVRIIRLHTTDILYFPCNGGFSIDTGGFNTHTTRDRLNKFLPAPWGVFTKRGVIHLRNRETGDAVPFVQRAGVTRSGKVHSDFKPAAHDKERKRIDALLAVYKTKGLPSLEASGGDPWVINRGKVDAWVMKDWVKTRYATRTLYCLALAFAGMTDEGVAIHCMMTDRRNGKLDRIDLSRIRRYVRACLGGEA